MTALSDTSVITVGGVLLLSNIVLVILQVRQSIAPRPPNQDLDNRLTQHDVTLAEHARRLDGIESAHTSCVRVEQDEHNKLYTRINACATAATEANAKLDILIRLQERKS